MNRKQISALCSAFRTNLRKRLYKALKFNKTTLQALIQYDFTNFMSIKQDLLKLIKEIVHKILEIGPK